MRSHCGKYTKFKNRNGDGFLIDNGANNYIYENNLRIYEKLSDFQIMVDEINKLSKGTTLQY